MDGPFVYRRMLNGRLSKFIFVIELLLLHVAWKVLFSLFYRRTTHTVHFQRIGFLTSKTKRIQCINISILSIYVRSA